MRLTTSDYEKIIYLMSNSDLQSSNPLHNIQLLLSSLFDLNHSVFWFSDSQCNMYNMQFMNQPDPLILDYTEVYKEEDFMHPKKQSSHILGKRNLVVGMNHVVESYDFYNSEYYHFMNKHNVIDQMVVYFTDERRISGGIGFTRFKGDMPFTEKDRIVLQTLSLHINQLIKNYMAMEEYQAVNSFHRTKLHVDLGVVQIGKHQQILFYNETAQEIVHQIKPMETVESFVTKYILSNAENELPALNKPYCMNIDNWTIKIVPNDHPTPIPYSIYMYKKTSGEEENQLLKLLSRRELEMYELVLKGYTNEEISNQLFISINTVKKHLGNMYQKLGVSNRTSLIHKLKNGL